MDTDYLCENCEVWVEQTELVKVDKNKKVILMFLCEKCQMMLDGIPRSYYDTYTD
jgi:hypothetical protein